MNISRTKATLVACAALCCCGILLAHPDDPKGMIKRVPYAGPGYRRTAPPSLDKAYRTGAEGAAVGFPSSGVQLESWLTLAEISGGTSGNDCWGYVSPSGREYAIMGTRNGTAFVEISDPGNPQFITSIAGPLSTWRDIKTYQHYAYSVTEGSSGRIQVINLAQIDSGIVTLTATVTQDINDAFLATTSTHNVAIDEVSGYLYRCGGGNNGLRIYSLANPASPVYVGAWSDRYVHDAQVVTYLSGPYAGKQIAFCCSGFNGGGTQTGLDILDVTNKGNIIDLSRLLYANGRYSHQAWLSTDRSLLYLNDELDETGLGIPTNTKIIDVQDLANPVELPSFTNGNSSIGHNLYTLGSLIFEANYRSGLRVFDASDPLAPVETAYFDTWASDDNPNYNGLWSVYPFFPSGTIIGSDIESGLFVWSLPNPPDGQGQLALDLPAGPVAFVDPHGGTAIELHVDEIQGTLDPTSLYLNWSSVGGPGQTLFQSTGGGNYRAEFPALACQSAVSYSITAQTTGGNAFRLPAAAPDTYQAIAGRRVIVAFEDNMQTNTGWTRRNSGLIAGAWETRPEVPVGGGDLNDPPTDFDGSGKCWLTDNRDGNSDVDAGGTCIETPSIDATVIADPWVSYARWFVCTDVPDDQFLVRVTNNLGATWHDVQAIDSIGGWEIHTFRISDFVTPGVYTRVRFCVEDDPDNSITEAAVDAFRLFRFLCKDGDTNGDESVNVVDLLDLLAAWGPCTVAPEKCVQDFDGDGTITIEDLLMLLENWG